MSTPSRENQSLIARQGLRATVDAVQGRIQQVYSEYPQPLVVGYSGGKDSTAVLQLVWNALAALPPTALTKPL
jgi:DNA sulfur modification protein DndC